MEVVAVMGASSDRDRYSFKAIRLLQEHGHRVLPIHPKEKEILGIPVISDLKALINLGIKIDTLTMYVNPTISSKMINEIIDLTPGRVIFNPGTENVELERVLKEKGIEIQEACTLVLLRTGQF